MIKEYIENHRKHTNYYETYVGTFLGVPLIVKNLLILAVVVSTFYNFLYLALAGIFSILFHEYSHVFAGRKFGVTTDKVKIGLILGAAEMDDELEDDPKKEFWIAFAGPLSNFLLFIISTALLIGCFFAVDLVIISSGFLINVLALYTIEFLFWFATLNLLVGLSNLIPAFPLDGGRMLRAVLTKKFKPDEATKISITISQIISLFFIAIGIAYKFYFLSVMFALIGAIALYLQKTFYS
jgi:Zn-dependent protease